MKKKRTLILLLTLSVCLLLRAAEVGQWSAYMAYHDLTDIEPAGQTIYVLSSNDLFAYHVNDGSVTIYNKVYPLSDTEISKIAWNPTVKKLLIVYSNYNIDLLDANDNVENISNFYSASLLRDKTVRHITIYQHYAFLSTDAGVLKINMRNAEIADTYYFGYAVANVAVNNDNIYAQTLLGAVYCGSLTANLNDPAAWTLASQWSDFSNSHDISVSSANGYTEYVAYDSTNQCYWSNQSDGRLQAFTLDANGQRTVILSSIAPDGPKYNYFNYLYHKNGRLYTSGGGWRVGSQYNRPGTVQVLADDGWTIYQDDMTPVYGTKYQDACAIAIDPANADHLFVGTAGTGIYEFLNGKCVNNFSLGNSPYRSAAFDAMDNDIPDYVRVDGLVFDGNGNLWTLNSDGVYGLVEYTNSGEWMSFMPSALLRSDGKRAASILKGSIIDSRGLLWFVNNYYDNCGLFCYNIERNELTVFNTFVNQDGTQLSPDAVRCVAEDKNGDIWIGTNVGPLLLSTAMMSDPSNGFTQVKVPRNDGTDYADYLLSGIDITAIAIDGANRKWFATSDNGVYLISADNLTQLQHFQQSNSALLSDNIEGMAINDQTGEVFFGTDKGLCSYMSDATAAADEMSHEAVWAYPNPVRPDYSGMITITGLTLDADVKIVTANGTLVNEGRSNGGLYQWDGCDRSGKPVASGVYMVLTAKSDGSKGTVCKIAIVR